MVEEITGKDIRTFSMRLNLMYSRNKTRIVKIRERRNRNDRKIFTFLIFSPK